MPPQFLSALQKSANGQSRPSGFDFDSRFFIESREKVWATETGDGTGRGPHQAHAQVMSPVTRGAGIRNADYCDAGPTTTKRSPLNQPSAAAHTNLSEPASTAPSLHKSLFGRIRRGLGAVFDRVDDDDDCNNTVAARTRDGNAVVNSTVASQASADANGMPSFSALNQNCEDMQELSVEGSANSFTRSDFYSKYEVLNPSIGTGSTCLVMEIQMRIPQHNEGRHDSRVDGYGKDHESPPSQSNGTCKYACKVIKMCGAEGGSNDQYATTREMIMMELRVMRSLRCHPSILTLHDVIWSETTKECFLVTELAKGGTLANALQMRGRLEESVAREVMLQVLEGLAFMHRLGLAHRDLKMENIFLLEPDDFSPGNVQIADFGLSKLVEGSLGAAGPKSSHSICGSPLYIAPEMLEFYKVDPDNAGKNLAKYGLKIDMWACGIVLYQLLSGRDPFTHAKGIHSLFLAIKAGEYNVSSYEWSRVSREARDIVMCLLQVDPKKRLTADEALEHPWITGSDPTLELHRRSL